MNILDYCMHDAELNLATEFKRMIVRAFELHPSETMKAISMRLGISEKTLYRVLDRWEITTPKREAKKLKHHTP